MVALHLGPVHGDVPVVAVALELRALVRVAQVVERQRVDRQLLGEEGELVLVEIAHLDDEQRALTAARFGEVLGIDGLALRDAVGEAPGLDHRRQPTNPDRPG